MSIRPFCLASQLRCGHNAAVFRLLYGQAWQLPQLKKFSSIICLASNKDVILFDEPVLGFDAIMRVKFYDMLTKSFQKHPRIIIVSTHIIEEIVKTIQKLIIIDKGSIRFFDTLQSVETKAYRVSGLQKDVEAATRTLNIIGHDAVGGLVTNYIFDTPPEQAASSEIHPLSLQDFFYRCLDIREVQQNDSYFYDCKALTCKQ